MTVWYDDKLKPLHRPLILTITDSKVTIEGEEDRGKAEIPAETSGEGKIAVAGRYLIQALKACGSIADLHVVNAHSPTMFTVDSYRCVVMPLAVEETQAEAKAEPTKAKVKRKRKAETEAVAKTEGIAEEVAQAEEPVTAEDMSTAQVVA